MLRKLYATVVVNWHNGDATQHAAQIELDLCGIVAYVAVRRCSVCVNAAVELNVLDYVAVRQRTAPYGVLVNHRQTEKISIHNRLVICMYHLLSIYTVISKAYN